MRHFEAEKYHRLFGEWDDPIMRAHEKAEIDLIGKIVNPQRKTFIDLGAGYGRILPYVCPVARNIIAIDINPDMFCELERRSNKYKNTTVILGDMSELTLTAAKNDVKKPVLLLLQNTLGTIEGDWKKVLEEMKKTAKKYHGEIILSLYRQQALAGWGLMTYWHGIEMNGEPDLGKTDLENGFFISKTGYISKWWKDEEIEWIKDFFGGKVTAEIAAKEFVVFSLSL